MDPLVVVYRQRTNRLQAIRNSEQMALGCLAFYRSHPVEFIVDWIDTYDPRVIAEGKKPNMPFLLYERQKDMVNFIHSCIAERASGLIEKSRDMGATWTAAAYSIWAWLYVPGVSIGWGSRKAQLLDRLGDPSSIFEKMRLILSRLPVDFLPEGFDEKKHVMFTRFINPENGSTIIGESGDEIGRGGRTSFYFTDESAHYERPERVEAALSDNTVCRVDMSSVSGLGTPFARRRDAGVDWLPGNPMAHDRANVFILDWRHHPKKDDNWYEERKDKARKEGLLHIFAQEVDRDYSAALSNILIQRDWVRAAVDLHLKIPELLEGGHVAGLDVSDEGVDKNALAARKGMTLQHCEDWPYGNTGNTARKAVSDLEHSGMLPIDLCYDAVGVGAGVKSELNRLSSDGLLPRGFSFAPWNAGASPLNKDKRFDYEDFKGILIGDLYLNLKAQAWWELRYKLEHCWRVVHEAAEYPPDKLLSIDSATVDVVSLEKELCQVTSGQTSSRKQVIEKTPSGMRSPNKADAVVMCYWPTKASAYSQSLLAAMGR